MGIIQIWVFTDMRSQRVYRDFWPKDPPWWQNSLLQLGVLGREEGAALPTVLSLGEGPEKPSV